MPRETSMAGPGQCSAWFGGSPISSFARRHSQHVTSVSDDLADLRVKPGLVLSPVRKGQGSNAASEDFRDLRCALSLPFL